MAAEDNKAVIRRLVDELWVKGNPSIVDELLTPAWVDHTPVPGLPPGREGLKALNAGFLSAFSDAETTVDLMVAEGDRIGWQWTFSGTHTGEFQGIPATGRRITVSGMTVDRLAYGKLIERWSVTDNLGFMQQLNPAPEPAAV